MIVAKPANIAGQDAKTNEIHNVVMNGTTLENSITSNAVNIKTECKTSYTNQYGDDWGNA